MSKPALLGGKPVFPKGHAWPNWPQPTPAGERRLLEAYRGGAWGIGAPALAEFAERFAESLGVRHVLPVSTGTAALTLTLKALGIGPDDEVVVPAYTFIASATCGLELEAGVVFADIHPTTLNLDPASVAERITPRTKAIVAVHFAGNPCDVEGLRRVIGDRPIALVEDAAHAHGMISRGRAAGKHGRAAAFSFQSSKNMSSGEGGAVATDDTALFELAEGYHSFGRRPGRPWYEHHDLSWNLRLSGFQAAVLLDQLEALEPQAQQRWDHGEFLNAALAALPGQRPQAQHERSPDTRRAYHLYMWRYDAEAAGLPREKFLAALAAEGVPAWGGYLRPLQEQPLFTERRFWHRHRRNSAGESASAASTPAHGEPGYAAMETPVASALCRDAVWLSQALLLAPRAEMQGVVDAITRVLDHAGELAGHELEAGAPA